jgi:hypothetical protein
MDVIDEWLEYHVRRFDVVYVSDNGSWDGTWERLLSWRPHIMVRQIASQDYMQSKWVYEMDDALRSFGCTWAVNLDADEFLEGSMRAACAIAEMNGINQIYPHGTFMRATTGDSADPSVTQRIVHHDPWSKKYTNDKAIIRTAGLTGVCQGNHWGYWDHETKSVQIDDLRLYHYEQRSPAQIVKKYSGAASPEKIKNMGEGWVALNKLWRDGGDEALIAYWHEHCIYDRAYLEIGGIHG